MMRATIGEARRQFEQDVAPRANDPVTRRGREVLAEAEQHAREFARRYVERREVEVVQLRDQALRELTEVRDSFDALAGASAEARITASECASDLARLRERQRIAEGQLDRAEEIARDIEKVEADEIAWFDSLSRRIPMLKQAFPW